MMFFLSVLCVSPKDTHDNTMFVCLFLGYLVVFIVEGKMKFITDACLLSVEATATRHSSIIVTQVRACISRCRPHDHTAGWNNRLSSRGRIFNWLTHCLTPLLVL